MAYSLSAASLSKLVLAHDCNDDNLDTLVDSYAVRSVDTIPSAIRWFYCAGLGVALLGMGIISLTHVYKTVEGQRLDRRYAVCCLFQHGSGQEDRRGCFGPDISTLRTSSLKSFASELRPTASFRRRSVTRKSRQSTQCVFHIKYVR